MDSQKQVNSVDFAINAVGGMRPLARLLGISAPSVWEWRHRGQIPVTRVLQIERLTGVSRHVLRPDIYPIESRRKRA
jgi:DNA-binding transcriptional regulator YdaS (Cro superfamily)